MTRGALALLVAGLTLIGPAAAQQYPAEVETAAGRIFTSTMSPYCPGRTLATCPSPQAADLRDEVKAWVAAGLSNDSIQGILYARYGEIVRAAPRARGVGLIAWVVPGLVLLVGGMLLVVWLADVRDARPPPIAPDPGDALGPADRDRLDRELSRL